MNIKEDKRHYYIKALLNGLKVSPFASDHENTLLHHIIQMPQWNKPIEILKSKNDVINTAINYIAELEAEVEKLQYVARIIEAAQRSTEYD